MTHFGFYCHPMWVKTSCFLTPTLYLLNERTSLTFSQQYCYHTNSSKISHSFERTVIFLFPYLYTISLIISLQLKDRLGMHQLLNKFAPLMAFSTSVTRLSLLVILYLSVLTSVALHIHESNIDYIPSPQPQ